MATRGAKPKPANLKLITGAPERRPKESFVHIDTKAKPLGPPPAYFNDEMKMTWAELVRGVPKGVLTIGDRALVENTVMVVLTARHAWRDDGAIAPNMSAELRRCLSEMHMTPSSRSKIVSPNQDGNPFEAL